MSREHKQFPEDNLPESEWTIPSDDLTFEEKLYKAYGINDEHNRRNFFGPESPNENINPNASVAEILSTLRYENCSQVQLPQREPSKTKKYHKPSRQQKHKKRH